MWKINKADGKDVQIGSELLTAHKEKAHSPRFAVLILTLFLFRRLVICLLLEFVRARVCLMDINQHAELGFVGILANLNPTSQ